MCHVNKVWEQFIELVAFRGENWSRALQRQHDWIQTAVAVNEILARLWTSSPFVPQLSCYTVQLFHFNRLLLLKCITDESFSYTSLTHTPIGKNNHKLDLFNISLVSPRQETYEQMETLASNIFYWEKNKTVISHAYYPLEQGYHIGPAT